MNCDICQRPHHAQKRPFLCAVDARNRCYEGRLRNLQLMMENENLQNQIHDLISSTTKPVPTLSLSEQRLAEDKTTQIIAQADRLRAEIAAVKTEINSRREALARRKSDLESVSSGIVDRRDGYQRNTEAYIQRGNTLLERCTEQTSSTRGFLCHEAAKLYGLRRIKKGTSSRYEYRLGGLEIIELASMNTLTPEVISTSLAHIAHILVLASHYLAIRLPAEVTLPHRDYPRPTIFNLSSSYHHGDVPFPGTAAIPTFGADNRDREAQYIPRPRPLFIDKSLPSLAKDDPSAYKMFLEGVTLLAYDVAWACCSQGISIGDRSSFDDVCNLGRNLYMLLIGQYVYSNSPTSRTLLSTTPASPNTQSSTASGEQHGDMAKAASLLGRYSHGTAHHFLGSAEGMDFIKGFKLPSPKNMADKLRSQLTSEAAVPEPWEMVGDDEGWRPEENDDGILVGDRRTKGIGLSTTGTSTAGTGTNGWTRVKARRT